MLRNALIAFFLLALLPLCAQAQPLPETAAVEKYLNNIRTLKARFIQTSQDGSKIAGDFMLKRPGRLKFTYDAPVQDFIVADGIFIYYYDAALGEQSSAPISQSLADFFLRKNLALSGDVKVMDVKRDGGLLQVTLAQTADPMAGTLTLGFIEAPLQLKKWRVVDSMGAVTEVELFETAEGIKLDSGLFHYYDPKRKRPGLNK